MGKTLGVGAFVVALVAVGAHAADLVEPASFDTTLPPSFNMGMSTQLANVLTSCMAPQIGDALKNLGDGILNGPPQGVSIGTSCPSANPPGLGDRLSCETFMIDGKMNVERIKKYIMQNKTAGDGLRCQKSKFEALEGELGCLSQQANTLTGMVGSLQDAYTNNIQRMQTDVAQLKAVITDRQAQLEETTTRLQGNGSSGEPGLLKLKEGMMQMLQGNPSMATEIQVVKEQQRTAAEQRRALEEQVQSRTMALTAECFKTKGSAEYRCSKNGPIVSAYEFALCRYQEEGTIGEDRIKEKSTKAKIHAQAGASALKSVLDSIIGDTPASAKMPTNPEEAAAAMDTNLNVLSVADIESQYGDDLAKVTAEGNGFDFHGFITASIGNCFKLANRRVKRERKRANTAIGRSDYAILQMERDSKKKVDELLTKYGQAYTEAMRGLTGMNLPLNTQACNNASPSTQANCLDDIKTQFQGLISGNVPQSGVQMMIKGNNPKTNIVFQCQGIDGCITTLQNVSRNLNTEIKRVDQFKTDYVQRANQNTERFTKALASQLSPQSQALNDRLKALNTALASLGVRAGIKVDRVEGEKMEKDEDGLYQTPNSALALIGGQMNPPMLDVNADNFGSALDGIAEGKEKLNEKFAQVTENEGNLQALLTTCGAKPLKGAVEGVEGLIENLTEARCGNTVEGYCGRQPQVTQLLETVEGLADDPTGGIDPEVMENLSTGIQDACPSSFRQPELPKSEGGGPVLMTGEDWRPVGTKCARIFSRLRGKIDRIGSAAKNAAASAGAAE